MEFEITIEGPSEAIETLSCLLGDSTVSPARLPFPEPDSDPLAAISLRETDPEILNRKLRRIASLIATAEQEAHCRDSLKMRVRNLAYSEPSCDKEGDFEPFRPVPSITIQPMSLPVHRHIAPESIILDPCHAFGTGKHPTTRLCLEILDSIAHGEHWGNSFARWKVLDFGCGTGLLAIAAVRLGAKEAVGIEIDNDSAEAAERNVYLNRLSDRIQIRKGSWEAAKGTYDLILANLVPSVLFRTGDNIPVHLKKRGIVAVSGFGEGLLEEMALFFSEAGLTILERFSLEAWGALLMAPQRR